jgi:pSer/pThr/pTyr-binding forkhead associated (FHA) protein
VGAPTLTLVPAAGGAPIEVRGERVLVGREPSVDIVLNDPSVSRRHAILERRGAMWVVLDQQSANGTWLDDHRVTEAALRAGQRLRLGMVTLAVNLAEAAAPAAASAPTYARPRPAPASAPAPAYAPPPPAAPAPPARPAAGPPAAGMNPAEAAEMLGLWPGSPPDEVRKRYQKLYNDFQIRLTNAPTPSLKKMYQKNIQDLRAAAEALAPGSV